MAGDAQDTALRLRAVCEELSERFFERDDVVRTLVVTLLAGQHSLVLGPPGTAKSELARELTGRIDGAAYWEILLSKFTAPTRMFGPIDVAALARGEYRQVYDGRATTAHVAFIDEIFKCSTAALNETLGYLNERIYHPENGGAPIRCPLIGAITASNELPDGEDSAAIYDRLLVRIEVGYLDLTSRRPTGGLRMSLTTYTVTAWMDCSPSSWNPKCATGWTPCRPSTSSRSTSTSVCRRSRVPSWASPMPGISATVSASCVRRSTAPPYESPTGSHPNAPLSC